MGRTVTLEHPKAGSIELDESILERGEVVDLGETPHELNTWSAWVQAVVDEDGDTVGTLLYVDSVTPGEIFPHFKKGSK